MLFFFNLTMAKKMKYFKYLFLLSSLFLGAATAQESIIINGHTHIAVTVFVNGQPKKIWTHDPNTCAKCTLDKLKETNRQILNHWYGAKKP